jgi:hypothetical protein
MSKWQRHGVWLALIARDESRVVTRNGGCGAPSSLTAIGEITILRRNPIVDRTSFLVIANHHGI